MPLRHSALLGLCLLAILLSPAIGHAEDHIVHVEEDWELVIGDPAPNLSAPQVTCVISPLGNADDLHAIFNLNHQTYADFVPGGMQLQVWHHETPITDRNFPNGSLANEPGEVVRWTQEMSLQNGELRFSITNGSSTTWGTFGNQGYLSAKLPTNLPHLDHYSPSVSLANSGVVFAANRVNSLVLKQVRVHTESGQVHTLQLNKSALD